MVYQEIHDSLRSIKNEIGEIKEKIDKKQLFLNLLRTPIEKVEQYIDLVKKQKNTVNKKRREIDRLISDLETEFRFIKTDMVSLNELIQLNVDLTKKQTQSDETENYLLFQISGVLEILVKEKFIDKMPNNVSYRLTDLGEIAVNIAEIHPLIISKLIYSDWNFFEQFTEKQIVGLLSCFTDIRVNQDIRAITPVSKDLFLKSRISEIKTSYQDIESVENELSVFTGIDYRDSLIFDIIDESMEWCDCETEQECKYFIQTKISGEKSISIGDFTKALLKIVVIVKELVSMVENAKVKNNHVELLHKLGKIEPMILKYIATNQSLYVE
jgi:hypothetical protein